MPRLRSGKPLNRPPQHHGRKKWLRSGASTMTSAAWFGRDVLSRHMSCGLNLGALNVHQIDPSFEAARLERRRGRRRCRLCS